MAIVGIDQSLTATAISTLNDDGEMLSTFTISPPKKLGLGVKRLDFIMARIIEHLMTIDERFVIVREGYSYASKGQVFNLGELGGCIDLGIFRADLPNFVSYSIIPPNSWKKYCFGLGSVKKDTGYLLKVYKKIGIEFEEDNQADSYMIARTMWAMFMAINDEDFFKGLTNIQKEALVPLKTEGVTKARIKKFDHPTFVEKLNGVMKGIQSFDKSEAEGRMARILRCE